MVSELVAMESIGIYYIDSLKLGLRTCKNSYVFISYFLLLHTQIYLDDKLALHWQYHCIGIAIEFLVSTKKYTKYL